VGARFSPPVETGPGGSPSLLYHGYQVFFPGVKRPSRGVYQSPRSRDEVKERVELHVYSPSGSSWPVIGRTSPYTVLVLHVVSCMISLCVVTEIQGGSNMTGTNCD
jgi:hypothetical protein